MLTAFNRTTISRASGAVVPFATVTFESQQSGLPVNVFSDVDGQNNLGSSVQSDSEGDIKVFAPGGLYKITISDGSGPIDTLNYEVITGDIAVLDSVALSMGGSGNTRTILNSAGSNVTLPLSSSSDAGLMSTGQWAKLDSVETGAQANVGTNLSLGGSGNSQIILSSTGNDVTLPLSAPTSAGLMSSSQWGKLDSVETGAQVNVGTDLSTSHGLASVTIISSTGNNATILGATGGEAGVMIPADKTKLDGIESGAQVNVGTDLTVTYQTSLVTIASSTGTNDSIKPANFGDNEAGVMSAAQAGKLDDIEAGAQVNVGTNITTVYSTSDITINSSTGNGDTLRLVNAFGQGSAGLMSASDKNKLDGIETGAQVNVGTDILVQYSTNNVTIASSTGTNDSIKPANAGDDEAGVMSAAQAGKLDSIESGAQVNVGTNITTVYSSSEIAINSSTGSGDTLRLVNAFGQGSAGLMSATDKTKLNGIETGAQVNVGTNLGIGGSGNSRSITSSTGGNVSIPVATVDNAGFMSTNDKVALNSALTDFTVTYSSTNVGFNGPSGEIDSIKTANFGDDEAGVMSAAQAGKLDGIQTGAQVNDSYSFAATGYGSTQVTVELEKNSGPGPSFTIVGAESIDSGGTSDRAGLMTAADKTKLEDLSGTTITLQYSTNSVTINSSSGAGDTLKEASSGDDEAGVMSSADKGKLNGIESGAQVNVGTNLSMGGSGNSQIIVSSTGNNVTLPLSAPTSAGLLSSSQWGKLDSIETGAQVNVGTNLGLSRNSTTNTITSSTGLNVVVNSADTSNAGVMTSAQVSKLNGIDAGAEVNVGTNLSWFRDSGDGVVVESSTGNDTRLPMAVNSGNDGLMFGSDKTKLDGSTSANTANTLVERNGSGDINCRLFRSEYTSQNGNVNFIMTQVETGTGNNFIRPSNLTQIRSALNVENGAQANVPTNLGKSSGGTDLTITSSTGSNVSLGGATTTTAGLVTNSTQTWGGQKSFTTRIATDNIRTRTGNTIGISAGEFGPTLEANMTGEIVWLAGEQGVKVVSSTDNLSSGWGGRQEATLIDNNGNSQFPGQVTAGSFSGDGSNLTGVATTNLSRTLSSTTVTINSSTGNNTSIPGATTSNAGIMTADDKSTLELSKPFGGINSGILNYPVGTIILVEQTGSNPSRNASQTIYLFAANSSQFTFYGPAGNGTLLGTWRARGATHATGDGHTLMQRIS